MYKTLVFEKLKQNKDKQLLYASKEKKIWVKFLPREFKNFRYFLGERELLGK